MQIKDLPDVGRALVDTDQFALDDSNGTTKKTTLARLAPTPYVASITTGQWSGSGSDRYITVQASNVTADSILIPSYDSTSQSRLNGPVWCVPAAGSFTIHTTAIPSNTVTIMVQFVGTLGTAQYQVLSDVYSKSQVDSIVAQSTAHAIQASTGGLQLNSTLMAYKMILLVFRRYGYWDSLAVPVSLITGGTTTAGAFIRFNTNEIKVTINTTGLVELTGTGASDLFVEAYGLF